MIDELDRIMTAYGTISIKTPDVWGQDRLAKFRSEYEAQMAGLAQAGLQERHQCRRPAHRVRSHAGAGRGERSPAAADRPRHRRTHNAHDRRQSVSTAIAAQVAGRAQSRARSVSAGPPEKTPVALEPTVVLDEHSNYLNHLNQLRRINAGDDLTDRPGYGLYLIRIPVTLSPGPRSRRGKGAIITVSAKSVMTKHTLRDAASKRRDQRDRDQLDPGDRQPARAQAATRDPGRGAGTFSLLSFADTELYHGAENIALLKSETERQLAGELGDEPHHRSARIAEWLRGELQSILSSLRSRRRRRVKTAELAAANRSARRAGRLDPQARFPTNRPGATAATTATRSSCRPAGGSSAPGDGESMEQRKRVVSILSFALRIQAAGVNRRLEARHGRSGSRAQPRIAQANQLLRARAVGRSTARFSEIC